MWSTPASLLATAAILTLSLTAPPASPAMCPPPPSLLATAAILTLSLTAPPAATASAAPAASAAATASARSAAHAGQPAGPRPRVIAAPRGTRYACPATARPGTAACLSLVRTGLASHHGLLRTGLGPPGYSPRNLQGAYDLPSATAGHGQTIAVVDAYDDPDAAADLAVYRSQFKLPACTMASGCFRKVSQYGTSHYPAVYPGGGWETEESLDLDMVSAICPNCHILLVEAASSTVANLGQAVDEAVKLGARYVSNSYGASESRADLTFDREYYDHPGVAVTASSGDLGYGVEYPAASQYVTAVGGTTLSRDASAVANPYTGVSFYDSFEGPGWNEAGGTSVAAPIIAASYALAGPPQAGSHPAASP